MPSNKKYTLKQLIKLKILSKEIERICIETNEFDYVTFYTEKIIKMYIDSNYDEGIYKIVTKYRASSVCDMEYIIKFINYYIESKYNEEALSIILNNNITTGNKIIKLDKKYNH